jgi:serine/threonine protein phosphatase PrpC
MGWEIGKALDIGGRAEQQDRVGILSRADGTVHLLVVADGMGGHAAGAEAAQTVIDVVRDRFSCDGLDDPQSSLGTMCRDAHTAIKARGASQGPTPGSTCALLYLTGPEAYWAHVGDSRLYHLRAGAVRAQTLDHSAAQLMAAQGATAGAALQNQLFMRLGGDSPPEPDFGASDVDDGDIFLLCSDGFWQWIAPEEVWRELETRSVKEAAHRLVALAEERGGRTGDNISLAVARWRSPTPGRGLRDRLRSILGRRPGR